MSKNDLNSNGPARLPRLNLMGDMQARGLDSRLRKEFGNADRQDDMSSTEQLAKSKGEYSSNKDKKPIGLPLALVLKQLSKPLRQFSVASDDVLLAHYGELSSEGNLVLLGRELGVDLKLNTGQPAALKRAKTPFVCLLEDQTGIGVLGKNAAGKWICQTATGKVALDQKQLQEFATGSWIGISQVKVGQKESGEGSSVDLNQAHSGSLLKRFAGLVFENKGRQLFQLWAAAILSNIILITLPLFITIVYDRVIPHGAFETLAALGIGVLIVFSIDIGLRATRINIVEAIGVGTGLKLQTLFYRKLLCMPLASSQKSSSGISALLGEVDHVALAMPALFAGLLADLPFVIVMLALVGYLSGPVVLAPMIGILIIVAVNLIGTMRARKAAGEAHVLRLKHQDETVSTAMMLPTVKIVGAENELLNRWELNADETAFKMNRARQASALSAQIALVLTQLIIAFTIVIGAIQINSGAMTLGNLAASVLLVGRILSPVSTVVSQVGQLRNMGGALKTFFAAIDQPDERGGDEVGSRQDQFKGDLKLSNVSFTHEGATSKCLENINLAIKPGERIGIIGRNGCGKSTLIKLIPRLFDPDSGTFLIDGHNAQQISPQYLRRSIGMMSQDTVLMQDSLRANICLGLSGVDPVQFDRAVKVSGVAGLAQQHPQGYSLDVGPRGDALSGGERQQVGLARAILRDPKILILDEPTAAMDNSTEAALIQAFPAFLDGRTLILATHRTQMLALVDRIVLMENGKIIADGPKEQVLNSLLKAG